MEKRGLIVNIVQCYLHTWKRFDALVVATAREHEREIERRAAISLVDGWVDLEVGPLARRD